MSTEQLDDTTKEILKEMGVEEEPSIESPEEPGDLTETKVVPQAEKSSEDEEPQGEEPDESESEQETDEDYEVNPYKQPTMPVAKHQKQKQKLKEKYEGELEAKARRIEELEAEVEKVRVAPNTEKVSALAEKYGFDEGFITDIIQEVRGNIPDVSKELAAFREKQARLNQDIMYEDDFKKNLVGVIKEEFPDVTTEVLNKVKDEVKRLKFTNELAAVPLDYIFLRHKNKFETIINPKIKKTAERSKSGAGGNEVAIDFDSVTPEDLKTMTDKQFDEYSNAMAKKEGRFKIVKPL